MPGRDESKLTYRKARAFIDDPDAAPQPPENVRELAAEIDQSLSREIRPDVRAWALWRVLLGALDEVLDPTPLEPEHDELAGKGVISLSRAITWPAHLSAKRQVEDALGE